MLRLAEILMEEEEESAALRRRRSAFRGQRVVVSDDPTHGRHAAKPARPVVSFDESSLAGAASSSLSSSTPTVSPVIRPTVVVVPSGTSEFAVATVTSVAKEPNTTTPPAQQRRRAFAKERSTARVSSRVESEAPPPLEAATATSSSSSASNSSFCFSAFSPVPSRTHSCNNNNSQSSMDITIQTSQPPTSVATPLPTLHFEPPTLLLPTTAASATGDGEQKRAFKSPPLICEQGPSAPSSPTSPGGTRLRRPSPIIVSEDAINRINLLQGGSGFPDMSRMTLLSPAGYATSDLGSSPRSSFSAPNSHSPLLLGPWTAFRETRSRGSVDADDASSECGRGHGGHKDLLSPGMMLSPAPFSPFSDCTDGQETPFSAFTRSPNLSPHLPLSGLHFSFDQMRSVSSMSHHGADAHAAAAASLLVPLDRERSRSDGEMAASSSGASDEHMDTSTISVPLTSNCASRSTGQYKKRLLQKYEAEQERRPTASSAAHPPPAKQRSTSSPPPGSATESEVDDFDLRSISRRCSRQPTVDEGCSLSTTDLTFGVQEALGHKKQIDLWMEQQMAAIQQLYRSPEMQARLALSAAVAASAAAAQQQHHHHQMQHQQSHPPPNPSLLAPPVEHLPKLMARQATIDTPSGSSGPIKNSVTLWRRSRSLTDVSQQPATFVCEHCGQAFALHDRLAKHIASRHRDRTPSTDENAKVHKCTTCNKSFGRSDMLTRHMRLHTGHKPYGCQLCGQVFSRSDHLSTHQRTHTGEKPYNCPLCNYAASRRDMITRHMRTHLRPDGPPLELGAHQIQQMSMICGINPSNTDLRTLMSALGTSLDESVPVTVVPDVSAAAAAAPSPQRPSSPPRSAFQATSKAAAAAAALLSATPHPQQHQHQQQQHHPPFLARQASIGGYAIPP